jgi:hypothetical protein
MRHKGGEKIMILDWFTLAGLVAVLALLGFMFALCRIDGCGH